MYVGIDIVQGNEMGHKLDGVTALSSSLGNRSIAGSSMYRSWQL